MSLTGRSARSIPLTLGHHPRLDPRLEVSIFSSLFTTGLVCATSEILYEDAMSELARRRARETSPTRSGYAHVFKPRRQTVQLPQEASIAQKRPSSQDRSHKEVGGEVEGEVG